ncbi:MAG: hypothetical protein NTU88_15395, partial [Armatimonadetes bacterium]|nr:hypothetical protein [Armatimonadota bacterium]
MSRRGEFMVKTREFVFGLIVMATVLLGCSAVGAQEGETRMKSQTVAEPNIEIAKQWWDDLPKKWTMIGWPEHLTRFDVLHDGSLACYFAYDKGPGRPVQVRHTIPEPVTQFTFVPAGSIGEVPA